jgi:hypothetical protein
MAGLGARLFPAFSKLTAAQVNGYLMDQSIMRFASAAVRDAAFGGVGEPTLAEGMTCYLDDLNALLVYNGSNWIQITPTAAAVQITSETFTGTNYTTNQPATAGPAISIVTGTTALITVGSAFTVNAGVQGFQSVAVTGATTQAASDAYALIVGNMSTTVNFVQGYSKTLFITGLTAGLNTFTCQYRVTAGTGTIAQRYISGTGLLQA